jgi:hypothetical protein
VEAPFSVIYSHTVFALTQPTREERRTRDANSGNSCASGECGVLVAASSSFDAAVPRAMLVVRVRSISDQIVGLPSGYLPPQQNEGLNHCASSTSEGVL